MASHGCHLCSGGCNSPSSSRIGGQVNGRIAGPRCSPSVPQTRTDATCACFIESQRPWAAVDARWQRPLGRASHIHCAVCWAPCRAAQARARRSVLSLLLCDGERLWLYIPGAELKYLAMGGQRIREAAILQLGADCNPLPLKPAAKAAECASLAASSVGLSP